MRQQDVIIVKSLHNLDVSKVIVLDMHIIMVAADRQSIFRINLNVRNIPILHFQNRGVISA